MMPNFTEGRYDAGQLRRNRLTIAGVMFACMAACIVGAASTSWPWGNALASSALILVFGSCMWWMFASSKSGPVRLTKQTKDELKNTYPKPR